MKLFILIILSLGVISCASPQKKENSYSGHGTESVSKETLTKYAPTPIPQELSRKIQNYLDIRSPGMGMLHPDGKHLYFTWRVTGTSQIWKIDEPKGFPTQMTGGEDQTQLKAITSDGKYLVISRDRNGEENPGLYLQPTEGGALVEIQHKSKIQTLFQGLSEDGHWIYFRSNDLDPSSYAIYKYSLKTKEKKLLFHEKGFWTIIDIHQNGDLLLAKVMSNVHNEVYLLKSNEKNPIPLFGQNEVQEYEVLFAPKPNEYFIVTPKFSDFKRLYLWKENQFQPLTKEMKADISGMGISENRKTLSYAVNDQGYSKSHLIEIASLKEIPLPIPHDADHAYVGWMSRQGDLVTLGIETATAPRSSYIFDLKTKKLTQWLLTSSPEVDTTKFSRASLETYTTHDQVQIPMFVRRPPKCPKGQEENCAVIVDFHGGPEAQSTPGFSVYAQIFVDAGFIFVEPNVRGSDGYGRKWIDSDNGKKRLEVITDIEDAAKYLRTKWGVKKIGITGGSYGGYSTFYAMTKFAGSYDAGVETVGMSNLVTFLQNTAPYRRALRAAEYGDLEKDRAALIELSPSSHIQKIKAPLMMIQGVNDPRVPAGEAIQFAEHLRSKNIPNELILFPDEGHGTAKRSNQVLQIGKTLEFFERHLK